MGENTLLGFSSQIFPVLVVLEENNFKTQIKVMSSSQTGFQETSRVSHFTSPLSAENI